MCASGFGYLLNFLAGVLVVKGARMRGDRGLVDGLMVVLLSGGIVAR
jgi:hypothetical protein